MTSQYATSSKWVLHVNGSPTGTLCFPMFFLSVFSSPELLGSQGELIVYRSSRRPSVVCPSTIFKDFSSETAWSIKAKFYVEPPWEGGTKVCINHYVNISVYTKPLK